MLQRILLGSICLVSVVLSAQVSDSGRAALNYYGQAKRYFQHPNPTDQTDSSAFLLYQKASALFKPSRATAAMLFDCYEKIGILNQTFGNQPTALANYQKAIVTNRRFRLPDSLLFIPYLYSGSAHYFLHSFDSSSHYFKRAEMIYARYPRVSEAQRLFNSFGVLYYEVGNYRQSINYFRKALQLNLRKSELDSSAVYSYRNNIASALRHLNHYDSAAAIYKSLIPLTPDPTVLYINLGMTYLDKHDPAQALLYLAKARSNPDNKVMLENALGMVFWQQKQYTTAERHLKQSLAAHRETGKKRAKNSKTGLTYKLLGDITQQKKQFRLALHYYQRSIIELDYDFDKTDVYRNPQNYAQNFSSYLLFESLTAKADCWLALHQQQPDKAYRKAAIDTYRSAFRLAEYIEKTFDNEEARLFVVQKLYPVYQQAVDFMTRVHEETQEEEFLVEAFQWSEKSKAAVLAITIKENTVKSFSGIPDSLLSQERDLRYNLSRLLLRSENAIRSGETEALTAQIHDTELNLSRLTDQLHDYPEYYRQKFSFDSVSVGHLRQNLLHSRTALLSYYHTANGLLGFVVTKQGIHHFRVAKDARFDQSLRLLLLSLQSVVPGQRFRGDRHTQLLHTKLISPAESYLSGIRSLIIIPHDELRLLPFDVLQNQRQHYLLESYDITYQYSAIFLQSRPVGSVKVDNILSMAPFNGPNPGGGYAQLTASRQEVAPLKGTQLLGHSATKVRFLTYASQYSVIHLATHAVVDNDDPQRSFVAFHPAPGPAHRLYARELIYGLLPKAQLVFLSACETASGKLIRGEGVMSLSRAFSFAGCPNLVTSLWKAEDNATAYISTRFYAHLRAGYSFSQALQRAKLDLLQNREYAQFHSPQYWAHLVFIGTPGRDQLPWLTYLMAVVVVGSLIGVVWWRNARKRTTPSSPARAD